MKQKSRRLGVSTGKKRGVAIFRFFPYVILALFVVWFIGMGFLFSSQNITSTTHGSDYDHPVNRRENQNIQENDGGKLVRRAAVGRVMEVLLQLARMPKDNLRQALNESDFFHLEALERGTCPWNGAIDSTVDWLPEKPSPELLKIFREKSRDVRPVVLWFEHLSKAGGTSFCKLAQANMPRISVPNYYCMPSLPNEQDGRVGTWTNSELTKYISQKPHRIVSNEWDPFPPQVMELQPKTSNSAEFRRGVFNGPKTPSSPTVEPMLIFLTSIRNPLDRLLSAYKFWGILHNPSNEKPSLSQWLCRFQGRAHKYANMRRRGVVRGPMFRANVGNFNFATWKFSNGSLPLLPEPDEEDSIEAMTAVSLEEEEWVIPFEQAVKTLSKFHLIIPMELFSTNILQNILQDMLGWTKFDRDHVVPSGKVLNNAAILQLPPNEYEALWNANWLDMILYHWSRAIFLANIHCAKVLQ